MNENSNKHNALTVPFLFVSIALIVTIIIIILLLSKSEKQIENQKKQISNPVEKLTDSIDIPGCDALYLKAGETKQNIVLSNPPQNFCLFKISLVLPNKTILWVSEFIAPGKESKPIVLSEPLEKGTYENAKLIFQCFSDENEKVPLNGAEIKLTLYVK